MLSLVAMLGHPSFSAHAESSLSGSMPRGAGFALVVWGGGTPQALVDAAGSSGCDVAAEWIAMDGALYGYIDGAPALVNQQFLAQFANATIPAGTALVLVCRAAGGPGESAPRIAAVSASSAATLDQQFDTAILNAINGTRLANGLPPLIPNASLHNAAKKYAQLLLDRHAFDHSLDGLPWDRAQREGYPTAVVGEVLGLSATLESLDVPTHTKLILDAWLASPGHRDIILNKNFAFTDGGAGCIVGKNTQDQNVVICSVLEGVP